MKSTKRRPRLGFLRSLFRYQYFPIFLLLICFLAYSVLMPWLHVFADDLSFLFYYRTLGRTGFLQALGTERPGQGFLYSLTIPLLGTSPLVWQIFALLTRWLAAFTLWLMLCELWPDNKRQIVWITTLFAVFPGFHQHWVVLTYSHLYLILSLTFFSMWSMLKSFRAGKSYPIFLFLSLLASASNLFVSEYFFGIELTRPIIIWLYLTKSQPNLKRRVGDVFKKYWPYILLLIIYLVWRFFIFKSEKYNPQLITLYGNSFSGILLGLLKDIFIGFYTVSIQVWGDLYKFFTINFSGVSNLLVLGVLFIGLVLTAGYFLLSERSNPDTEVQKKNKVLHWCLQAIPFAIIAIFFNLIPFKIGGFPISLESPWDRFMLAFMFSSSLLAVAICELIGHLFKPMKYVLIILLISLSIGSQYATANSYRKALILERNFFWQLSWRIPDLKTGTILMTDNMNLPYYSENTLSSHLNYLYDSNLNSTQLLYVFAFIDGRIRDLGTIYQPNEMLELCDRIFCFSGSSSNIIVYKYFQSGCLRIMDPIYTNEKALAPEVSPSLRNAVPYSSLDRILVSSENAKVPQDPDFGSEPLRDWCYYFEKADLARQNKEWDSIVAIWNQSQTLGFTSYQGSEYFPFVEAFAHTGNWIAAKDLTNLSYKNENSNSGICDLWLRIEFQVSDKSKTGVEITDQIIAQFGCRSLP